MTTLACCDAPNLATQATDLGHADSFEFTLRNCAHCGAYWMHVFCVANAQSGYESVSAADAAQMLALESGHARKEFMRDWGYKHT